LHPAATQQEFLNIYDGGKSFGTETSVKRGGFSYIRVVNGVLDKLSTVADLSFLPPLLINI